MPAKRIVRRIVTAPSSPVDLAALEDASRSAVELITSWRGTVVRVDVLGARHGARSRFLVGADPGCDLPLPPAPLGGHASLPLVTVAPDSGVEITVPAGVAGDLTLADGDRASFAGMATAGLLHASAELAGCVRLPLPHGATAAFELGGFSFVAKSVPAPRRLPAAVKLNWNDQLFSGASLAFHFLVVFIAFFDVPNLMAMSLDLLDDPNRGVRYEALELQKKAVLAEPRKDDAGSGKRARDEEGQAGKRDAPRTRNKMAIQGPRDNPRPQLSREMARDAGILQYLARPNAAVSPFAQSDAMGQDPENALGALLGDRFGDNLGYGGLGIHGTGRGGGGDATGTIGTGSLDTIGHDPNGRDKRYGEVGDPRERIRRGADPIRPVHTGAVVYGSLTKDQIRRVVRNHLGDVKFCYERELAARPDLAGRVSVQFVINGVGAVQTAVAKESTLGSIALDACIAQAVRRWTFPQPAGGGVVIVTYPFQLETPQE
jgi:hypothetical protein